MGCSLLGSSVHGLLQAKIPGWVAIPNSRGSSWPRAWTWVSCIAGRFVFTIWATRKPHKGKLLPNVPLLSGCWVESVPPPFLSWTYVASLTISIFSISSAAISSGLQMHIDNYPGRQDLQVQKVPKWAWIHAPPPSTDCSCPRPESHLDSFWIS